MIACICRRTKTPKYKYIRIPIFKYMCCFFNLSKYWPCGICRPSAELFVRFLLNGYNIFSRFRFKFDVCGIIVVCLTSVTSFNLNSVLFVIFIKSVCHEYNSFKRKSKLRDILYIGLLLIMDGTL